MSVDWTIRRFDDLEVGTLYDLLALRAAVFVVEQQCVFQDIDGLDRGAIHVLGHRGGQLVTSLRILPSGVAFDTATIGRVVVHPDHRRLGLARMVMQHALEILAGAPVSLAAQEHLVPFYRSLGFEPISEPYDEDGLSHVDMRRP